MIDTIELYIPHRRFVIRNCTAFVPEFTTRRYEDLSLNERTRINYRVPYARSFRLHAIRQEGVPLIPGVEIYEKVNQLERRVDYEMKIHIPSLPCFYFSNSLQEFTSAHADPVFELVSRRLKGLGILVSKEVISESPASVVHFAKNLPLTPDLQIRTILNALAKTDAGKAYDTNDVRFRDTNNGRAVHVRCGTRAWAFYDKIEDMQRPNNKNSGGWNTADERDLVASYGLEDLEVFRFEYRLNKMQTIRSEMNAALGRDSKTPVLFRDLFSDALWKTVLQRSWKRLVDRPANQMALLDVERKWKVWQHVFATAARKKKTAHSRNNTMIAWCLASATMDFGVKTVLMDLNRHWSHRAGDRLKDRFKEAADFIEGFPPQDGILYITEGLERFEPVTLDSLSAEVNRRKNQSL